MNYYGIIRLIRGTKIFEYENRTKNYIGFGTGTKVTRLFIFKNKKRYRELDSNKRYNFAYYDNFDNRIVGDYMRESKLLLRLIRKDFG